MIVCDTSYLVKAILEDESLLKGEQFVAPDIIIYEVPNAIWKHECLLKNLKNGQHYIAAFYELIESGKISILTPNETLTQDAYRIAKQNNITTYDAIFISVALQYGLSMKTLDKVKDHIFKSESDKAKK